MSLAEVKEEIERMTPQERAELENLLRALRASHSADYQERVATAHREIEAGKFITLGQLKEIVAKNEAGHRKP